MKCIIDFFNYVRYCFILFSGSRRSLKNVERKSIPVILLYLLLFLVIVILIEFVLLLQGLYFPLAGKFAILFWLLEDIIFILLFSFVFSYLVKFLHRDKDFSKIFKVVISLSVAGVFINLFLEQFSYYFIMYLFQFDFIKSYQIYMIYPILAFMLFTYIAKIYFFIAGPFKKSKACDFMHHLFICGLFIVFAVIIYLWIDLKLILFDMNFF